MRLSFSQLDTYMNCGEKYRLRYMMGLKEETPAWWSAAGTAIHSATEAWDRKAPRYAPADPHATLPELWDDAFHKAVNDLEKRSGVPSTKWKSNSKGQDGEYWATNGLKHLTGYVDWRVETGWWVAEFEGIPAIELEVGGEIGGAEFIGYIDRVFMNEAGEYVIVDLKSGNSTPYIPLQHGVYRELLEQTYGVTADLGAFFKTLKGELTTPVDLSPYVPELLGSLVGPLLRARETDTFAPSPSFMCSACGVRSSCSIASVLPYPIKAVRAPRLKTLKKG